MKKYLILIVSLMAFFIPALAEETKNHDKSSHDSSENNKHHGEHDNHDNHEEHEDKKGHDNQEKHDH